MSNIKVFDNFLPPEEADHVFDYCLSASYTYGERDNFDTPPVGMVSELLSDSKVLSIFENAISHSVPEVKNYNLNRAYINCFSPSENPYFHTDGKSGFTLLYYSNKDWEVNDNGETQILLNSQIVGILPISNRMLLFDANLLHRATSFRDRYRFTIALKYK